MTDEDNYKLFETGDCEALFTELFGAFDIVQPDEYFLDHPTDDSDLVCNIQSKQEFLISTLEMFDLPEGYMFKQGHFPDWGKESSDKSAAAKMRAMQKMK